jgi:methyltransferase (TIGR00027 family)
MKENQASSTAFTVAQGIVYSGRYSKMRAHVPKDMLESSEMVLSALSEGRQRLQQLSNPVKRTLLETLERVLIPGMSFHYVFRKLYIEHLVRQGIADGFRQVVILGAGFDMLAWRLSQENPDTTFIEIDHPATSDAKQQAMKDVAATSVNYHLLAADLSQHKLENVLADFAVYQSHPDTLFVCEGVLMYLKQEDVSSLFGALIKLTEQKCRFIFTALEPLDSPENNAGFLLKAYLRHQNEGLEWMLPQTRIGEFSQKNGFSLQDSANDVKIQQTLLPQALPKFFQRGEYTVLVEKI